MVDILALGITHLLLALAAWRLLLRDDLDREDVHQTTGDDPRG